jgi:hypothetical protein
MTKESRIQKQKDKLHKIYADYTDRQLLEQIAYSLMWIGIIIAILVGISFMKFLS